MVSGPAEGSNAAGLILDCGLATRNIYLAAQALGLGARIQTGLVSTVNQSLRNELGFPQGCSAVAVIRISRVKPPADGVSAASARNSLGGMVTYK